MYDKLHRRTSTTNELGHIWRTEYDKLGRVTRSIDATDQPTQFTYDGLGRLTAVEDALGGRTEYTYDTVGNLLEILDANGHVISGREYDNLNRLTRAEDGNGNYYTYGYDAVGNQTWVRDANAQPSGPTTNLSYDAMSRRTAMDYPDGSWVTFTYDDNGNREQMIESADPNTPSLFGYDDLNQLVTSVDRFNMRVDYGYNTVGKRTRLVYPGDNELTYSYDAANRLTSIADWAARTTQYTYDGLRIATVTYPNGVVEMHGYDTAGRLSGLNTTLDAATVLSFGWSRDAVGVPLTATETNTLTPTIPTRVVSYEYDSDNRLTESSKGTYEYDANGNLTSRTIDGVITNFEYDIEDRLITQTSDPNGPTPNTVEHVYDGAGNRIARTDPNGTTTRYVLDRSRSMSHVLCETDTGGSVIAYYIHGPTLVARIDAVGTPRYYHTNDLGSVVALTDPNGNVVDRYAYEPYGLPFGHEGTTPNPFTFVGGLGVMAEDDNLYFMRARFYDPDTGRFLGKDPVEGAFTNPLELNRYAYGLDNPVFVTDSSGEWFGLDDAVAALGGAIVGGVGTLAGDIVDMATGEKEWGEFSSWQTYTGNIAGGAVGGLVTIYAGPIAGAAAGGAVGNLAKQGLEYATGERKEFDGADFLLDTGISVGTSVISSGVKNIIKKPVGRPATRLLTKLTGKNALKTTWTNTGIDLLASIQGGQLNHLKPKSTESSSSVVTSAVAGAVSGGGGGSSTSGGSGGSSSSGRSTFVNHQRNVIHKMIQRARIARARAVHARIMRHFFPWWR